MAAPTDYSTIVASFMPSLFHLAAVKTAFPLYKNFEIETLDKVFTDFQNGNITGSNECNQGNKEVRARKVFSFIPAHLRKRVIEVVHGLSFSFKLWQRDHSRIIKLPEDRCFFYWRCDGTIDRYKTAQELVLNESINIRKRFEIACMYCLEKNIHVLWAEMEAFSKTENFETAGKSMAHFWINRFRDGSQVAWTKTVLENIDPPPREYFRTQTLNFSTLLPSLQPEDRQEFLFSLHLATLDDLRFCLYAVTRKEQEIIIERNTYSVLLVCLFWPLQDSFVETAQKMWNFIDVNFFCYVLRIMLFRMKFVKDYDYRELFEDFWNSSPNHLRVNLKESRYWTEEIDLFLNEIRRNRKSTDIVGTTSEEKISLDTA